MRYDAPIKLTSARAWRTYIGGSLIDKIHGVERSSDNHFPEEWIMSTVTARNAGREDIIEGICFLDENKSLSLKDYIEADPESSLGIAHVGKTGLSTGVLVKVIDAAERLTVQVHPNKQEALRLFNSQFGKTECWYVLGGRVIDDQVPSIYMGFKPGITREEWKRCFDEQDIPALLSHMHHIEVKPGDTWLIKGGVPHAIGTGCLLVEIQEPTDYTIRVERTTPKGLKVADMGCHQGLGFERMFDCFEYEGHTLEEAERLWKIQPIVLDSSDGYTRTEIVGYKETSCFRMEHYSIKDSCPIRTEGVFSGMYFLSGSGIIRTSRESVEYHGGDQFFVPADSADFEIIAKGETKTEMFRCFGPE